jgi:hypothetical protein
MLFFTNNLNRKAVEFINFLNKKYMKQISSIKTSTKFQKLAKIFARPLKLKWSCRVTSYPPSVSCLPPKKNNVTQARTK